MSRCDDSGVSTALLTDRYELTMLGSSLRDGTADRRCTFELFARRLPDGRRYGVVAGTARLLEALASFEFDEPALDAVRGFLGPDPVDYLAGHRFRGDVDGYAEGELYFPGSPVLSVRGTFAECVLLETLSLSILNHDSAIASAAARMVSAADGRPLIEMGSRRTHEDAAVAAARAAYIAGFASTSNLQARFTYGVPSGGTSAHAFTLVHDSEKESFAAQLASLGPGTTLLVDTFNVEQAVRAAAEAAGPRPGAVRSDSGDLPAHAVSVRALLDSLGATGTRIILTGDLDEYSIAGLAVAPVDGYGVGTSLVTGSGAPTAALVYKLGASSDTPPADSSTPGPRDVLRPVAKRSVGKPGRGGRKWAVRHRRAAGEAAAD